MPQHPRSDFTLRISGVKDAPLGSVDGLAGWFDVHFKGSKENPAAAAVHLTTEPNADGGTHWGQQVIPLPISAVVRTNQSVLARRLSGLLVPPTH